VHFPSLHPILRLTAPYCLVSRLEPLIISTLLPSTYGATYAANLQDILEGWNHMHPAEPARIGLEFGLRRGQGVHAATAISMGAYVGGIYGTSNTQTGLFGDTNLLGTVAHNLMQLFMPGAGGCLEYRDAPFTQWDAALRRRLDEVEPGQNQPYRERLDWESLAFVAIAQAMGERAVYLLDTVDTVAAARKLIWLYQKGLIGRFLGVRLDSGDLPELANRCAYLFAAAGMEWVKIFASNEISMATLPQLLGSKIDTIAVGTNFERSELSAVFKEVEIVRQDQQGALHTVPVYKVDQDDAGKSYYPGRHDRLRLIGRAANGAELFGGDLTLLPEEAARPLAEVWPGHVPDHERMESLLVPYLTAEGPADWLRETTVRQLHATARTYAAARRQLIPWSNSGYPVVASRGTQALREEREATVLANSFVPHD
jgi:nicotinate phosphoribosyltransferase